MSEAHGLLEVVVADIEPHGDVRVEVLPSFGTDLSEVDGVQAAESSFDRPTEAMDNAIPLLYQAGYITIKDYDFDSESYTLGIPNGEVRVGLMENLMPLSFKTSELAMNDMAIRFKKAIIKDDIEGALNALKSFFAGIPYPENKDTVLKTAEQMAAVISEPKDEERIRMTCPTSKKGCLPDLCV